MALPKLLGFRSRRSSKGFGISVTLCPSVDGVRNVIRLLGGGNEKIRRLKAEELVDESVVKRLEKEGRF